MYVCRVDGIGDFDFSANGEHRFTTFGARGLNLGNSTGAAPGTIYFGVWAKDPKSPNQYDTIANTTVNVT